MKRMLINATQPEELRVALVDGQRLFDLDIEAVGKEQRKSNIYKARIVRLEPSLEAAFVDYGADRHGFLPLKEVARHLFREKARQQSGRVNIREALEEGQELIVQVEKDERGNKGAALTTFISLAGRYLVAMPNNPKAGGVSRQIEGDAREEAKEAMASLSAPDDFGLILRTAGIGKGPEELQWDLDYLLQLWQAIDTAAKERQAPFLIYQDQNVIIRAIRDYLRSDIAEILIDDPTLYQTACDFMRQVMPGNITKLKLYQDSVPLFTRYQIESQIETAFSREVRLPSGGALVIEPTEALITIDINSAKATHGGDIEETALLTNLEAAEEIATQLRLRDLGGLIVVDFIDMMAAKNQRAVENKIRDCVKMDRARVQIGRISRFGLLEMSRQRLRPSLAEFSHERCPRCEGVGTIRSLRSTALTVLRVLEEEAMKDSTSKVVAEIPVDVATFLFNEKRRDLSRIEERQEVDIILVPNAKLETPHFHVQRIREQDLAKRELGESYQLVSEQGSAPALDYTKPAPVARQEQAAVRDIVRNAPQQPPVPEMQSAADVAAAPKGGVLKRFFSAIFGGTNGDSPAQTSAAAPATGRQQGSRGQQQARGNAGERNRDEQRRRGGRGERSERDRGERDEQRRGRGGRAEQPARQEQARGQQQPGRGEGERAEEGQRQAGERREGGDGNRRGNERREGGGRNRHRQRGEGRTQSATQGPEAESESTRAGGPEQESQRTDTPMSASENMQIQAAPVAPTPSFTPSVSPEPFQPLPVPSAPAAQPLAALSGVESNATPTAPARPERQEMAAPPAVSLSAGASAASNSPVPSLESQQQPTP